MTTPDHNTTGERLARIEESQKHAARESAEMKAALVDLAATLKTLLFEHERRESASLTDMRTAIMAALEDARARITALERWRWYAAGAVAALVLVAGKMGWL